MNNIIAYDTVKKLVENPPSLGDRPDFFNLRELRNHFARKLKSLECPQSRVNGWSGFILSPPMYALIDPNPWQMSQLNMPSIVPEFPPRFEPDGTTPKPYSREETMTITSKHTIQQNYHLTAQNIYRGVYDTLDAHVNDAFKVAPKTTPATVGWNSSMTLIDIFDQLMMTYGRPTPDAVRQNMMTFLAPYNPQDPPEILFKRCADCQEVAIIAKVKYTDEQLLMNVIDLLTRCGIYQRDLEDWERKDDADKTWLNLRPFIQDAYQRRLASGMMTAAQGGYSSRNRFAALTTGEAGDDDASDDTADTIAGTINSHMANLSAQTAASMQANATQINASLKQLADNNTQLHQQQQAMMQQMALLTTNANTVRPPAYVPPTTYATAVPYGNPTAQIYAAPPLHGMQQQYYPPRGGGRGGARSRGGRGRPRGRGNGGPPMPYIGGAGIIPYIPAGIQPHAQQQPQVRFSNITKNFANQNVCYSCGFDVEDWHTSATCNRKKQGHQDGFTRSNYMEYERANHPFCRKAMHKTMYPNPF